MIYAPSTRLDDEGGSKRSLLLCTNPPKLPRSSEDMVEQQALQVCMPPFQIFQCTADVYEASKTSGGLPSTEGNSSEIYIDDILLMADMEQKATFALLLTLDVLEWLPSELR